MTKKKIFILIAVITVFVISGCIGAWLYINRFDAEDYVEAVLDTSYKNETDLYVEITGVPEEEAEKIFDENLDITMEGFEQSEMPEDMLPMYRELFGEIARNVSYTTGEPKRQEDGTYIVPVTVKSITLFTDTYGTFQTRAQEYAREVTDSVTAGGQMPTEEEMQSRIYQIYYDVLKERVDSGMLYGAARDLGVRVSKDGLRSFSINEEDMEKLDSLLIESVGGGS